MYPVVGLVLVGDGLCKLGFVEGFLLEADGASCYFLATARHQRDDAAGIYTST